MNVDIACQTLVTGFGPFKGVTQNPSETLARESGREHRILEVSYRSVDEFVFSLDPNSFDCWLMMGVAAGRSKINVEMFARNVQHGRDIRGESKTGPIDSDGPLLLEATLWKPDLISDLLVSTDLLAVSMDAGAYLCNYISYQALRHFPGKEIGFLHVPATEKVSMVDQAAVLRDVVSRIESA